MGDSPVQLGEILAGKYRVESVLGSGGMGVVVAAVHVELGQRVALKFLLPHAVENGEAATRFLREARACVKIDSEHVARVIDVGRLESGAPYMVMEYLEGNDLSGHAHGEALPVAAAVDFVLQACAAMAVAHAVGVIHRDLKPANLFVTKRPDGSPLLKVLDFGISKVSVVDAPAGLTHSQAIMGSPHYMSPEQVQSARRVDVRTDIWSLGVILYELLTGVLPFPGEALGEVFTAVMTGTPKPVRALRPSVPPGLERAIMRALEKPLERRFANIGELSGALVDFAPPGSRVLHDRISGVMSRAGLSSAPPPPLLAKLASVQPPAPDAAPVVSATDTNWAERTKPRKGRGSLFAIATAGIVLLLCFGLVGAFLVHRQESSSEVRASAVAAPAVVPSPAPSATAATAGATLEPAVTAEVSATPAASQAAPPQSVAHGKPASSAHPNAPGAPKVSEPRALAAPAAPAASTAPAAPAHHKKNPLSIDFK
jgi:serine/threonine-protein kinase